LPDGHLNADGTRYLFDRLQQRIYDQQGWWSKQGL
jgi:hypothetical protein